MSEKEKINNTDDNNNDSINAIVASDKNDIEEATEKAMQNVDSVAYSGNLVKPNKQKSKSIRNLNIKDKKENLNEKNNKTDEIINNKINNNFKKIKNHVINNSEKKSNKIIILGIISIIILLIFLFSVIFTIINKNNNKIFNGIYINNYNISNLSKEEALNNLNNEFKIKSNKIITLKYNDYKIDISPEQIGLNYNLNKSINSAYEKGRSDNFIKNNYEVFFINIFKTNIIPEYSYNEKLFNTIINDINSNIDNHLIESGYYINENNLILVKGTDGIIVDSEKLQKEIATIILNSNESNIEILIPTKFKKANELNLDIINKEITKEPQNAYFTTDPYVIHPETNGIKLAISLDEAKKILNTSTEKTISIPLTFIAPEITIKDLGSEAFPNELGSYSTSYNQWNYNRTTNIILAAEKVDGTVIMPGEIFSYNATVGQRTAEGGFMPAAVYSGGEVTTGIGGGICQVSSTIYNAALLSNLEIVERYNHCFYPGYVPVGRDATVSWGSCDFCFKNNRNYPIKILCDGTSGSVDVQILGLYEETEYEVSIESYVTSWISYSTVKKEDPNLPKGEIIVDEEGSSGLNSVAYRILSLNGEEISRELLSYDSYSPHNRIEIIGTKVEQKNKN